MRARSGGTQRLTGNSGADHAPVQVTGFLRDVPVVAAPPADPRANGPSAPVWRAIRDPDSRVSWNQFPDA
ncbi:hypothetical protein [Streptomyces sp. NPDC050564]|uniref:hypothetical protein n=1 Tax=Streptomyces sp. NPDC050564 TaxID=3365631 RepID=UPI0037B2F1C1